MAVKIQLRRGTAAQWASANPVLSDGEVGLETDTDKMKIGNGITAWNSRPYANAGPAGPQGPAGSQGPQGDDGPQGIQGIQGPPGSISACWPIGSIFMSAVATNPATLLGFGTWAAFGTGRIPVGFDSGQTEFDTLGETGGAKTATPAGTVAAPTFTGTSNQATNAVTAGTPAGTINAHTTASDSNTTGGTAKVTGPGTHTFTGSAMGTHSHTLTPAGTNSAPSFTGSSMSILPPYVVCRFWQRTA